MLSAGSELSAKGSNHLLTASSNPFSTKLSAKLALEKLSHQLGARGEVEEGRTFA